MIEVQRHGNKILVRNPVIPGKQTEMINVIFIERGRSGGNSEMSGTSAFLDSLTGGGTSLELLRTHTHPVRAEKIGEFPVGKTFPGHINRKMTSIPGITQQENVQSRLIDGKPTFFQTYISSKPEDDLDLRVSNETLLKMDPKAFSNARVGGTSVEILERADFNNLEIPQEELEPAGMQGLEG